MKKSKSPGDTFFITGGDHASSDDFFKQARLRDNEKDIAKLKIQKKVKLEQRKREEEGMRIMEANLPFITSQPTGEVCTQPTTCHWRYLAPF